MDLIAAMIRNRVKIFDAGFVLAIFAAILLLILEVDLFENPRGLGEQARAVELDEFFILTTVFMLGTLFYAWRRAREHRRENEQRLAAEQEVLSLALHDALTGLPNRRRFDQALGSALAAMPTPPEAHAVLLLDLNGFKKINDVFGHGTGDQVLIHVGARLLRAAREGDMVARLGGDEFVILARNVPGPEGATSIALRVIEQLTPPIEVGGARYQVGTAIGIALAPSNGEQPEELLRKADVALYRAKTERRSTLRFFEEEMDRHLKERDALERALLAGLGHGEFHLRFEPARRADGRITAFEAQPCWTHPEKGPIEPERFIPIAAEAGVLAALTELLLRQACAAAATWPEEVRLAFNLPGALLSDPGFAGRILAVLSETGVAPQRLRLEVDEGALIRDAAGAQPLLEPLRQAGVAIIADHFGTGYSDLQNLNRLRLDGIKIDRSFVRAMTHDRQAAVMVRALIGIGHGLDLAVIADGVGTEQQRRALEEQGCEQGQGQLYGGSLTAAEALAELAGSA